MTIRRFLGNLALWAIFTIIALAAALSGMWMKPEPRGPRSEAVIIVRPSGPDASTLLPPAKTYPL